MRAALAERLGCGYLDNDATLADMGGCDAVALAGAGGILLHDGESRCVAHVARTARPLVCGIPASTADRGSRFMDPARDRHTDLPALRRGHPDRLRTADAPRPGSATMPAAPSPRCLRRDPVSGRGLSGGVGWIAAVPEVPASRLCFWLIRASRPARDRCAPRLAHPCGRPRAGHTVDVQARSALGVTMRVLDSTPRAIGTSGPRLLVFAPPGCRGPLGERDSLRAHAGRRER